VTVADPGTRSVTTAFFAIAGVPCAVTAGAREVAAIDETFGAFAVEQPPGGELYRLELRRDGPALTLTDSEGGSSRFDDGGEAVANACMQLTLGVMRRLARQGVFAIHAASLARGGDGVILAGPSRSGKTTLALELVRRGLRLLSDEHALSHPDATTILPYRRSLHVRPGTPELIPELGFLVQRPRRRLPGGEEWALRPEELARVFPGSLGEATELRHVVLLGPRSDRGAPRLEEVPGAIAAVELVGCTMAACDAFQPVLERMARLVEGARCARLVPGAPAASGELLLAWLDE
jgi:hypothetical protein